jgi:hypothetical protein
MKNLKGLGFLAMILVLALLFANILPKQEGFTTNYNQKYTDCIKNGYSKEFCVQNPISVGGPSTCMCDNGRRGRILPGYQGECVCDEEAIDIVEIPKSKKINIFNTTWNPEELFDPFNSFKSAY